MKAALPFVDENWQLHAKDNAAKGYRWAVWGCRSDRQSPLCLLCSVQTQERADSLASSYRVNLRPKGFWLVIVVDELA